MTETEWNLRRELAHTRMALIQNQVRLLELEFEKAKSAAAELGEKWEAPEEVKPDLKVV